MKIDGNAVFGPFKSMVTDAFTQYNANGIGVSITNGGYAQIVSLFTINTDVGVFAGSGGQCDITNSNSSFGNFGLVTDGVSPRKNSGVIVTEQTARQDTFAINLNTTNYNISNFEYDHTTGLTTVTTSSNHNFEVGMGVSLAGIGLSCAYGTKTYPDGDVGYVFDVKSVPAANKFTTHVGISTLAHTYVSGGTAKIDVVRPFDGQVVYFDKLYQEVQKIKVTAGGSNYTSAPTVTIGSPSVDFGIKATAVAVLKDGEIDTIDLVSSGRGYESTPTITISGGGGAGATASLVMRDKYYSILKLSLIHI